MPEYKYVGDHPILLSGLSQGVNAELHPTTEGVPPVGASIVINPGDTITTDQPYNAHNLIPEIVPVNLEETK
jgi:hypothetical protein